MKSPRKPRLLRGYKIMRVRGSELVSGADSRLLFPLQVGAIIQMPGKGIYLSTNRRYVLDFYSGYHDDEALLTLRFDPRDIIWGNLTDRQPEVGVRRVQILKIEPLT